MDETGRCIRGDKRGFISEKSAKTINDIGIDPNNWLDELKGFKSLGFSAIGTAEQLKEYSVKTKRPTVGATRPNGRSESSLNLLWNSPKNINSIPADYVCNRPARLKSAKSTSKPISPLT